MESTAVLLIDCPDRPGLVARVSSLLYEHGANILHADQHQDHELGLFFMRVEWGLAGTKTGTETEASLSGRSFDFTAFDRDFSRLAGELGMR